MEFVGEYMDARGEAGGLEAFGLGDLPDEGLLMGVGVSRELMVCGL